MINGGAEREGNMKIVCVCDSFIDRALQEKYRKLESLGAEVSIIENEDLIRDGTTA